MGADAGKMVLYKEINKECATKQIWAAAKHKVFAARKSFAALCRTLKWEDSPYGMRVPSLVDA